MAAEHFDAAPGKWHQQGLSGNSLTFLKAQAHDMISERIFKLQKTHFEGVI